MFVSLRNPVTRFEYVDNGAIVARVSSSAVCLILSLSPPSSCRHLLLLLHFVSSVSASARSSFSHVEIRRIARFRTAFENGRTNY